MDDMIEGVRVITHSAENYTAEVVLNRTVVWARGGYRSYTDAKRDADQQLARRKSKQGV